jgi:hypothetical protein
MAFFAGRLHRPSNPDLFFIQQTPVMAHSFPVVAKDAPLPDSFQHGEYISSFVRIRGRTILDEAGYPKDSVVLPTHLSTRYINAVEMDPDEHHAMFMKMVARIPGEVSVDTSLKGFKVTLPEEMAGIVSTPLHATPVAEAAMMDSDPFALQTKNATLMRNGNHVVISGVIAFMTYYDGGDQKSSSATHLFIQQSENPTEAIPVRIYGKEAIRVAESYSPGHTVFISGELRVDFKKVDDRYVTTPYIHTHSVEMAQISHVMFNAKTYPYPAWAQNLYLACNSNSKESREELQKRCRAMKKPTKASAAQPTATAAE